MLKQELLDIFYAITAIRKIQHIKPSTEKIYQYLYKINENVDKNLLVQNIEVMIRKGYLKIEGDDEQESIFILKSFDEFIDLSKTVTSTDKIYDEIAELENYIDPTEKRNQDVGNCSRPGSNISLLYERMITELKSEIIFLRDQSSKRDIYFQEEIKFLRKQVETLLGKEVINKEKEIIFVQKPFDTYKETAIITNKETPKDELHIISETVKDPNPQSIVTIDEDDTSNQVLREIVSKKDKSMDQTHSKLKKKTNSESTSTSKEKNEKKKIFILGDSMVKHAWEIPNQLEKKHKVYVRSFSSAKVKCMKGYIKPCIREEQPDHVILHVGTNNISSEQNAERIGKSIVDLAKLSVKDHCPVSISNIVPRNDKWNNKAQEVNSFLKNMCTNTGAGEEGGQGEPCPPSPMKFQ